MLMVRSQHNCCKSCIIINHNNKYDIIIIGTSNNCSNKKINSEVVIYQAQIMNIDSGDFQNKLIFLCFLETTVI